MGLTRFAKKSAWPLRSRTLSANYIERGSRVRTFFAGKIERRPRVPRLFAKESAWPLRGCTLSAKNIAWPLRVRTPKKDHRPLGPPVRCTLKKIASPDALRLFAFPIPIAADPRGRVRSFFPEPVVR